MTFLATNGVQSYARAVREAMADLPPEQAHEVLDGLDEHLAEIVAEGTTDLEEVLGSPEAYAAELRASAGLPAASRRTSWAAPPVELRSDVPASDGVDEFAEPLARSRGFGRLAAPLRRRLSTRRVGLSRSFLVVVFGSLLVYLIRSSRPMNFFEVVFGTLLIVGAWYLLRVASNSAELPADWVIYVPRVLGVTTVVFALILGSRSSGTQYVYVDNTPGSTTFATILPTPSDQGPVSVPNLIGVSLADTLSMLGRSGLTAVVAEGATDLSTRSITTRLDPAPGTLLDRGAVVRIFTATAADVIPTSGGSPTTATVPSSLASPSVPPVIPSIVTIAPSIATSSVTTGPSVVPEAGVTVPVVTTIGTTTVAAVPATAAPTPDQTVTK
jgi:hypothetical protein